MRPPGKSPQQIWFDDLPEYDPVASEEVYAIFTGVVNDVTNIVIYIDTSKVIRVLSVRGSQIWRFDYDASKLISDSVSGSNWAAHIANQLGPGYTSGTFMYIADLDYEMITCKIQPSQ